MIKDMSNDAYTPLNTATALATAEPRQAFEDEITLLKLQNHHLNARLIDHVNIEAARTDQIASVLQENELLRDELAELMQRVENLENFQEDLTPTLPVAFSDGLPVRRTPSPLPAAAPNAPRRSATSLGLRTKTVQGLLAPSRPQTSQAFTAPLRTRSTSPRPNIFSADFDASTLDSWFDVPEPISPRPLTPSLNLLPPTPAPARLAATAIATAQEESAPLGEVLSSLSNRSLSPRPGDFHPEISASATPQSSHTAMQTVSQNESPFNFSQQIMRRSGVDPDEGVESSQGELHGFLSELEGRADNQPSPLRPTLRSPVDLRPGPSSDDDSDFTTDDDNDSMSEVESLVDPRSNRSSNYTTTHSHARRESKLPEPQDMIFHLTQAMRLQRSEREMERAQWELEKRALVEKLAAASRDDQPCWCGMLAQGHANDASRDLKLASPPAYDFLKPWTYPLQTHDAVQGIDDRIRDLMSQAVELASERRMFEALALASDSGSEE